MNTIIRTLILSAASLAAAQCNIASAQAAPKALWSEEDTPAKLSFVYPEDENVPGSPARAEFVNPETQEPVAIASGAFGDTYPDAVSPEDSHTYLACRPDQRLHATQ